MTAVNVRCAAIPDNAGNIPRDRPVKEGGREAYFSTAPVRLIAEHIAAKGIPAEVSHFAGTYVCNDLYYTALDRFSSGGTPVLFVHLPAVPSWGEPSLESEKAAAALTVAAEIMIKTFEDRE